MQSSHSFEHSIHVHISVEKYVCEFFSSCLVFEPNTANFIFKHLMNVRRIQIQLEIWSLCERIGISLLDMEIFALPRLLIVE